MKLDMNAETPLYMQLKEAIKAAIKDGTYPDNEKIPTEIELSEHYKLSCKTSGKGNFCKIPQDPTQNGTSSWLC